MQRRCSVAFALLTVLMAGCGGLRDRAQRFFDSRTARERYQDGLVAAGLGKTALVQDWLAAADRALNQPARVTTPHVEEGFLAASDVIALGYRVSAKRGQEITFDISLRGDTTTTVFLDVWFAGPSGTPPTRVADADSGARALRYRPRRDGEYIVRAQPELLRSGRFAASLRVSATLAFPVKGGGERDIGSKFGASRDGGARSHHGIDIFAKRGTPVIAAAGGWVERVGEIGIGGNVVWMSDHDGNRLYYAHLDRWNVSEGQRVRIGDTLGFVGNTGNARTTAPHLHFGVYRGGEGPLDPFWYVHRPSTSSPKLVADTNAFGSWVRVAHGPVPLRVGPAAAADTAIGLTGSMDARVVAATADWYRVRLTDGTLGYVPARATERTAGPISDR